MTSHHSFLSARGVRPSLLLLFAWLGLGGASFAEPALPPKPTQYVSDTAGVLPVAAVAELNRQLEAFERSTSNQLLVAVFPSLPEGTYLEDYTVKTARAWGAGGKERDNAIILFAFIADRKLRIEVGYGLEGAVPDSISASIIRNEIRPRFKTGDYVGGITQGINALQKATRDEYKGDGKTLADSGSKSSWKGGLLLVLVILFLIWVHTGDTVLQRAGRGLVWGIAQGVFSGSSSDHHGGGGGGGWSGGGGDFGGGGASGDW